MKFFRRKKKNGATCSTNNINNTFFSNDNNINTLVLQPKPIGLLPLTQSQILRKCIVPQLRALQQVLPVHRALYEPAEMLGEYFDALPADIKYEIFSLCDLLTLYNCTFVSKAWNSFLGKSSNAWRMQASSLFHYDLTRDILAKQRVATALNWRALVIKVWTDLHFWENQNKTQGRLVDQVRLVMSDSSITDPNSFFVQCFRKATAISGTPSLTIEDATLLLPYAVRQYTRPPVYLDVLVLFLLVRPTALSRHSAPSKIYFAEWSSFPSLQISEDEVTLPSNAPAILDEFAQFYRKEVAQKEQKE